MALLTDELKMGWLKKQSRGGFLKNWKARFFVLDSGNISYFEKKKASNIPPYGENEKGIMNLRGAIINDTIDPKIIHIVGKAGEEKDLILEAENAKIAYEWRDAILQHIQAANFRFSSSQPDSALFKSMDSHHQQTRSTTDEYQIMPTPGFVIKTRRVNSGEKIFINVCEHPDVPATASSGLMGVGASWPYMISSPGRLECSHNQSKSAKKEDVWVYDVVVNPSVVSIANDDNIATRDLVCKEAIKHISKRYKDLLEKDFRLPLIQKVNISNLFHSHITIYYVTFK
jgi:hypothetical protein